mmetsp:Transcript_12178/g.25123  ORF Transcript_12178/g.25123 Transcript_12178/m.25123 type:complete len:216 (-) Transcript_12178:352-999(-)
MRIDHDRSRYRSFVCELDLGWRNSLPNASRADIHHLHAHCLGDGNLLGYHVDPLSVNFGSYLRGIKRRPADLLRDCFCRHGRRRRGRSHVANFGYNRPDSAGLRCDSHGTRQHPGALCLLGCSMFRLVRLHSCRLLGISQHRWHLAGMGCLCPVCILHLCPGNFPNRVLGYFHKALLRSLEGARGVGCRLRKKSGWRKSRGRRRETSRSRSRKGS